MYYSSVYLFLVFSELDLICCHWKWPSPGVSNVPSAGLQPGSADTSIREGRQNKKSKWDKVSYDLYSVVYPL